MTPPDVTNASNDNFQVMGGSQVFHEYTIVNGRILKVTAWWPPEIVPAHPGVYQGLVKGPRGEKVIRYFIWDGAKWRSNKTGKYTSKPFEWRGTVRSEEE
jgi:hypothetical protein